MSKGHEVDEEGEPIPEMIEAEFWKGHREQIEKAAEKAGMDFDWFIRSVVMTGVREVEDTGEITIGRPHYRYRRLTGVRGPNGGIFVSFEINEKVYHLIEQLLFKRGMIPSLHMEHVAMIQLMKVIDTFSDDEQLLRLIDRDTDTLSDFIERYTDFAEANPRHNERVAELLEALKREAQEAAA